MSGVFMRVREEKARLSLDPRQPKTTPKSRVSVRFIVCFCNKAYVLVCVCVAGHPAEQWRPEPGDGGRPRRGGGVEGMWSETPLCLPWLRRWHTSPGPVTWPEVGTHCPLTDIEVWTTDVEVWTTENEVWTIGIEVWTTNMVWNTFRFANTLTSRLSCRHGWCVTARTDIELYIDLFTRSVCFFFFVCQVASWLFADLLGISVHAFRTPERSQAPVLK